MLRQILNGLGGIYQRLLRQVNDKEALVPIIQWVVLAVRLLTLEELGVAVGVKAAGTFQQRKWPGGSLGSADCL